jgi:hypothetical protein
MASTNMQRDPSLSRGITASARHLLRDTPDRLDRIAEVPINSLAELVFSPQE